jgi:hypothetical protein
MAVTLKLEGAATSARIVGPYREGYSTVQVSYPVKPDGVVTIPEPNFAPFYYLLHTTVDGETAIQRVGFEN